MPDIEVYEETNQTNYTVIIDIKRIVYRRTYRRNSFHSIMKQMFDRHSLSTQLVLSFIGVVILTVAATGIPAILLFRGQLERQAWSQVDKGQSAAETLYAFRQSQLDDQASLIAHLPILAEFLMDNRITELEEYLSSLQSEMQADLVAVCGEDGSMLALSSQMNLPELCEPVEMNRFNLSYEDDRVRIWQVATQWVSREETVPARVVLADELDQEFIDRMRDLTGLDHTILVDDQPVLTSLESGIQPIRAISAQPVNPPLGRNLPCSRFELDCLPYYAARVDLNGQGLEAEVALEVGDIAETQRRLNWINTGTMFTVLALCSILGILLTRRISRPLVGLAASAERFSRGDLRSPVLVEAGVREEIQVAQALERARVDLLQTLTDLQREKDWINDLLDSIAEGIVTLDQDLHLTFFSQGAERITGWKRNDVLYRSCDQVFQLVEIKAKFSEIIPKPGQSAKALVYLAGDCQATLSITGARIGLTDTGNAQSVLVFRDISEEESTHRLLGHFLANVAHEFRTPLSALAASIELLLDQAEELSTSEIDELLRSLHLGILNLQTLVDNLLEGGSIEAGHFKVSTRSVDLETIITEAVSTMQPLLDKYGQRMAVDLPIPIPIVRADPRRTVQVLVNLVSNASRYGPTDDEITIRAQVIDGMVQVSVSDRGPGIHPEYRSDVFHRFLYPNSSEQVKAGAGLGLSVVKAVVEAQGGQVGVDDRPGGGSIFWFTLQVTEEQ
jgi:signal transduction histidine kinase